MKKLTIIAIATGLVIYCFSATAEEMLPGEIFEKVKATYDSLQTYKAEGIITQKTYYLEKWDTTETSFSILLKKPNLYLISWKKKNIAWPDRIDSSAVWSDGTQPFLYMGLSNTYTKMNDDAMALGGATGISNGVAHTIPSLFLPVFKESPSPFSRLKDPQIKKTDIVDGEECFVISGSSTISKLETFWISKYSYLIKKYLHSFEPPAGGFQFPEFTDEQLREAIEAMGQEISEESLQNMRDMMKGATEDLAESKLKGSSVEYHMNISFPELTKEDFQYALPEDATLKNSMFNEVPSGIE